MISLIFESGAGGLPEQLGPAPWFRVGGNFIHQGPQGNIAATYRNHFWETQGRHFTRYDCNEPVRIAFENAAGEPSEWFGPFAYVSCADGVVYAEDRLFAKFKEESDLWHCYPTNTYWPILVFGSP
ncbi:hypothetical protein sS8_0236 [Methylocaldum marinum]|uniref:Uncharacterized protein n=1 Tax=Methylocaldum marinum TaxID=1432792 RepID=A0A286P3I2_9GAMM|nr:hypothetical protein [Methylocaldum marinum]BBA32204.1 hypothetical protein sS8_0236 [Methylocaldum marinum]